jgi:hypothetical protein
MIAMINSADQAYRRAEGACRLASQREALGNQHEQARSATERLLRRPSAERDPGLER